MFYFFFSQKAARIEAQPWRRWVRADMKEAFELRLTVATDGPCRSQGHKPKTQIQIQIAQPFEKAQ